MVYPLTTMHSPRRRDQAVTKDKDLLTKLSVTFVMEQHLGHATFFENLHGHLNVNADVDIDWVKVRYDGATSHLWERIPLLPRRVRGRLRARTAVRQGLKKQLWNVAFFNTHVPARMAGSYLRQKPYLISTDITPLLHDTMSNYYGRPITQNPLLRFYKHWVHTQLFQNAAKVLPWSNWVRNSLINDYGVDPEKIEVIPPGVNVDLWQPLPKSNERQILHNADEKMRILFVGGDFYRKGGDLLRRVFHRLPEGAATLDIVTRTKVEGGLGITIHNGLVQNSPELLSLYRASDLFVFPTRAEAFGIAATEAAVMGLPVIAAFVGGLEDIVVHGETGFLFHPDDEEQLLAYLMQLIVKPDMRIKMGAVARARALRLFDAKRNADRILAVTQASART